MSKFRVNLRLRALGLTELFKAFFKNLTFQLFIIVVLFKKVFESDSQEISTIEQQELKNRFPSFFVHK